MPTKDHKKEESGNSLNRKKKKVDSQNDQQHHAFLDFVTQSGPAEQEHLGTCPKCSHKPHPKPTAPLV